MYTKIIICGTLEILTGLHIGTGGELAAIGAVDAPVVRDKLSDLPIIPGSSLKGKIRSLLARKYCPQAATADNDSVNIQRLFGASGNRTVSRLIFCDSTIKNNDDLKNLGVKSTEIKFENSINRISGAANPRQIERVIRGAMFDFEIIYTNVDKPDEIAEDISLLCEGMKLLEYDYLGGHGSRGDGRVKFRELSAKCVEGKNDETEALCNDELSKL